ncbi:unnamed protein product [Closterium sp. NIES-54]
MAGGSARSSDLSRVMQRVSELHGGITNAIERAIRDDFYSANNRRSDAPLLEVEDGPQPMSAMGGDLRHDGASLRHEGLALEKNAEARSLVAVRNALEELEAHLESLQDVSPAERELALMAVEAKRQELLQHLLAHQGREWQVVQELLGFIGDTSAPRTDLSLPPYTHPTAPGPLPPLYHTFHHQQLQNHPPASLATPLPAPRRPARDPPQQQTTPQAKAVAQQQQGRRAEARAHSQHQIPEQQQQQRRGQQSQHGPADSSSSMSSSRLLGAQFGTASSTSSPAHDDGEVDQAHGKGGTRSGQARGGKLAHMQQGSGGGDAGRQVRSMVSGEEGWWSEGTGHGGTCGGCMRGDASGSEREEQSWGSEGVGVRGGGSVSWQGTHGDDSSTACMCCSAAAAAGGGGRSSGLTSNTSPYMSTAAGRPSRSAAAAMTAPSRPSAAPPAPTALLGSLVQRVLLPSCQRAAGGIWGGFRMVLGRGGGVGAQVAMVTVGVCVGVGITLAARNHLPLPDSHKQQQRQHKKQHSKQHSLPAASASKPAAAAAPAATLSASTAKTNPSPPRLSDVSPAAAAAVAAAAAAAAAAATQRVGGVAGVDKGSGDGGVGQSMGGGAGSKSGGGSGVMVPSVVVVSREAVVPPCDAFPATNPASNLPASTAPATPSASSTSPCSQRQRQRGGHAAAHRPDIFEGRG